MTEDKNPFAEEIELRREAARKERRGVAPDLEGGVMPIPRDLEMALQKESDRARQALAGGSVPDVPKPGEERQDAPDASYIDNLIAQARAEAEAKPMRSENNRRLAFMPGDLVKLKPGGPDMVIEQCLEKKTPTHPTILSVVSYDAFVAHCSWFKDETYQYAEMPFGALAMIKPGPMHPSPLRMAINEGSDHDK